MKDETTPQDAGAMPPASDESMASAFRRIARSGDCLNVKALEDAADEIDRLRLTDEERAAVEWAAELEPEPSGRWTAIEEKKWNKRAAALRGLLERMGSGR